MVFMQDCICAVSRVPLCPSQWENLPLCKIGGFCARVEASWFYALRHIETYFLISLSLIAHQLVKEHSDGKKTKTEYDAILISFLVAVYHIYSIFALLMIFGGTWAF